MGSCGRGGSKARACSRGSLRARTTRRQPARGSRRGLLRLGRETPRPRRHRPLTRRRRPPSDWDWCDRVHARPGPARGPCACRLASRPQATPGRTARRRSRPERTARGPRCPHPRRHTGLGRRAHSPQRRPRPPSPCRRAWPAQSRHRRGLEKLSRLRESVLTDRRIQDQEHLVRRAVDGASRYSPDLVQLRHQIPPRMQATGRVDDDHGPPASLPSLNSIEDDRGRVGAGARAHDVDRRAPRPRLDLVDGRRAKRVGCTDQRVSPSQRQRCASFATVVVLPVPLTPTPRTTRRGVC